MATPNAIISLTKSSKKLFINQQLSRNYQETFFPNQEPPLSLIKTLFLIKNSLSSFSPQSSKLHLYSLANLLLMDYFNLSSAYRCSNYLEGYDCFVVQCDDMYCHTIVTNNEVCLRQWIVRLISHTSPNSGERMKVSMEMIWDQSDDDLSCFIPVTLQFCYENCCIIYHVTPPHNFPTLSLQNFLSYDSVGFFGFQMLYKVRYLRQRYNLAVKNWFDISCQVCLSAPAFLNNVSVPLQTLVSMIFSKVYVKPDDFLQSNWRLSKLSLDKIMFATLDCLFVCQIANLIKFPLPL